MNRDGMIESPYRVDDMRDDAALAYKEVMERSFKDEGGDEPAPAPAAKAPVEKDAADTSDQGDRARDPVTKRFVKGTPPSNNAPLHPTTDKPLATKTVDKKPVDVEQPEVVDPAAQPIKAAAPPPSFSIKTKATWDQLPEHVRADIVKREGEMAQGLSALRDFKDLKPYADMAKQSNTTIKAALDNYVGIENVLKKDIAAGLAQITQNFGLNQQQAAQLFARLAQKFGGQAAPGTQPDAQPDADPLAEMLKPILAPLVSQLGELKTAHTSRAEADRNAQMQSLGKAIEEFAADPANKFFPDLEDSIVTLIEKQIVPLTGNHAADLKAAYEMAARMNPAVHEALIDQRLTEQDEAKRKKEQDKVAKARQASRSISGSRVPGTVIQAAQDDDDGDDIEATVRKAYRLHAQS